MGSAVRGIGSKWDRPTRNAGWRYYTRPQYNFGVHAEPKTDDELMRTRFVVNPSPPRRRGRVAQSSEPDVPLCDRRAAVSGILLRAAVSGILLRAAVGKRGADGRVGA